MNSGFDSLFILRTINGGNNWNTQSSFNTTPTLPFTNISFLSVDTGFFCGGLSQNILMTTNSGLTLDTVYTYSSGFISAIHFPSKDTGYAVGDGFIFKTINGGFNWTMAPNSGNTDPLYSIFFTSNDTGYTVGGNGMNTGTILKTTTGGNSWVNEPAIIQTLQSVYFPSENIGYTCGTGGIIMKYDNGVGFQNLNSHSFSINTYPNPFYDVLTLQLPKLPLDPKVSILDSFGQVIYESKERFFSELKMDLSSYPAGIYFLRVMDEDKIAVKKIIKM